MIDHLVYATPDVDRTVADMAARFGVKAAAGGRHLGYGTRNALGQKRPAGGYWYGVENIQKPRLVTWTAQVEHIERVAAHAHGAGYKPGDVHKVFRERPDGVRLSWRLTFPTGSGDGLVPNLIEWDDCPHPADTSPQGVELVELVGFHPNPGSINTMLKALGVELEVRAAAAPGLMAVLETPYGPVELS